MIATKNKSEHLNYYHHCKTIFSNFLSMVPIIASLANFIANTLGLDIPML